MKRLALPTLAITLLLIAGCATSPTPAPVSSITTPAPVAAAATPPSPPPRSQLDAARRAQFDAALARWHGAPLSELQTKLGKPDTVTRRSDGRTAYAFTRTMASNTAPGGTSRFSCTVRYVVDDKTRLVQSHQIEGC